MTTTSDASLLGADDPLHLAFARKERRVILTNDPSFLALHDQGVDHPGIAFYHLQSSSIGDIIRGVELIWDILEPKEMHNKVEFL